MSSTDTLARLIPLRVVRKLFVIKTVLALVITAGKVKVDNADRALNLMFLAAVNSSKLRVDIRVKLVRVKSVLIVWIVVLPKLVSSPAFSQTRLPTVAGPSREITFAAFGPTTMVPATDVQLARGDASAWELMVIVGWEQKELVDVCATIMKSQQDSSLEGNADLQWMQIKKIDVNEFLTYQLHHQRRPKPGECIV